MAMPDFQVYRILVDTRKCFFSVYYTLYISLGSAVCEIVPKYKVISKVGITGAHLLWSFLYLCPQNTRIMKHVIHIHVTPARL